jgi:perosamine synthetase
MKIPLSRPDVSNQDIDAVVNVLKTPFLSLGPAIEEFERAMCDYTGARHATAVNSGTSALHLAVRAMGIGPGDEVITSPFSFVASANCALFENARPVFVDIDPHSFNIDADRIEAAVTERTKALLPVHVFGRPAAMDHIGRIATRHGLRIIEDACEALGAYWHDRHVGTIGDAGTFAFYPNKQVTTGEGGMLVTNDRTLDELFKSMRNQGRGTNGEWLQHQRIGYNYRLSDIHAALGTSQLQRVEPILAMRAAVADMYRQYLCDVDDLELPMYELAEARLSWFVYVVRLKGATRGRRDALLAYLRARGVACSDYFSPIHLQPYFREQGYRPGQFPITEAIAESTVALPFFTRLSEQDVKYVAATLKAGLMEHRPAVGARRHEGIPG